MRTPHGGRQLGDVARVRTRGVLPVGEQDDRGPAVVADVGLLVEATSDSATLVMGRVYDGAQGSEQAPTERGLALGIEPADRREHRCLVRRRALRDQPGAAEGDDAEPDRRRLLLDELPGRCLGSLEPGGLDVSGRHARRHVEGEHDSAFAMWSRTAATGLVIATMSTTRAAT